MSRCNFVGLARSRKDLTAGCSRRVGDGFCNMLFNSLFQALRRAANIPTVAVAHKLIYYVAVIMGRQHVFFDSWKELSSCKNNTGFDGEKAAFHSSLVFTDAAA